MKPLFLLVLFTAAAPALLSATTATADYVQANASRLHGKKHSVQIVGVQPGSVVDETQWFQAFTWDGEGRGSWIEVLVPLEDAPGFAKKFGTDTPTWMTRDVRNKRLFATVRISAGGTAYLDLTTDKPSSASEPTIRTWTSTDGRTVQAELLDADRTRIRIRRLADGQEFAYPLLQLSSEDRDFIEAWLRVNR